MVGQHHRLQDGKESCKQQITELNRGGKHSAANPDMNCVGFTYGLGRVGSDSDLVWLN